MRRLPILLVLAATLVVAACDASPAASPAASAAAPSSLAGQSSASVIPVIVSTRQVPGPNRFVFSFLDPAKNVPVGSPDRKASVAFIAPGETQPGPSTEATFVW